MIPSVFLGFNSIGNTYPDTTLPNSIPVTINNNINNKIEPHDGYAYSMGGAGESWEHLFRQELPSDTLSIYIFSRDTLKTYDWSIIRDKYKVLIRYDLSLPDILNLNHRIYYPPTPAMKAMKMYPPYPASHWIKICPCWRMHFARAFLKYCKIITSYHVSKDYSKLWDLHKT